MDLQFYILLPYLSQKLYITLQNNDDERLIYGIDLDGKRTLLIATDDDIIVSVFIQNNKNLNKQISNGRFSIKSQLGETTNPLILNCPAGSCPKAFWRQADFIQQLYQNLNNISISQEDFIVLTNSIIDSKEKIAKYKKHYESLNAVDKIEITEEIEKLESLVLSNIDEIDSLVYELYGLSGDEVRIVEDK